jgi:uncharacterized protein (TIGR04222 family)
MSSAEQIEVDDQAPATGILDPLFQRIFVVNLAEHDEIYSFEDKLSRQSSWTKGYAQRVVNEYRRFLYLTQVSEVPIAPSDAVDQAWHLHLLQTHFYWNVLCKDILGKELHHTPTVSGASGRETDITRYSNVLSEYEKVFGGSPPPDIWPSVEDRFFAIRKSDPRGPSFSSQFPRWIGIALISVFSGLTLLLWGKLSAYLDIKDFRSESLPVVFFALPIAMAILWYLVSMIASASAKVQDLDEYEAAYLKGGNNHVINTALIRLVEFGLVSFVTNGQFGNNGEAKCRSTYTPDPSVQVALDPFESAVLEILRSKKRDSTLDSLSIAASKSISNLRTRLIWANLVHANGQVSVYNFIVALMGSFTILITFLVFFAIEKNIGISLLWTLGWIAIGLGVPSTVALGRLFSKAKTNNGVASLDEATHRAKSMASPLPLRFAVLGTEAVIDDKRFYGINYLAGAMTPTAHSDDKAGCGDNLPKCG